MITIIKKPIVEMLFSSGLDLVEQGARCCVNNKMVKNEHAIENEIENKKQKQYLKNIFDRGHLSVFEHSIATFKIKMSRNCLAQITRHRHSSFSVQSQRYCCYKNSGEIVLLENLPYDLNKIIINSVTASFNIYKAILKEVEKDKNICSKLAPQIARKVLPGCWATELVVSANYREWLHIFELRADDPAAETEIRLICQEIKKLLDLGFLF